jgi:hypothetical protein
MLIVGMTMFFDGVTTVFVDVTMVNGGVTVVFMV